MKGRRSIFLEKKLQSVIFKLVVEDTALHAYHNPLQIVAQMDDEVSQYFSCSIKGSTKIFRAFCGQDL